MEACTEVAESALIGLCQRHLVHALRARIAAVEQRIGARYGFETIARAETTAFLAHGWPSGGANLPFHRVFDYRSPQSAHDLLLERFVHERIDAVVEVLPGAHQAASASMLQRYGFQPAWQIPWLHMPLHSFDANAFVRGMLRHIAPTELAQLAQILCDAYGYGGEEAAAWRVFAEHGYRAPGFACFLAMVEQQPAAAGVVHVHETSALVDGAGTLPMFRGRGIQKALLAVRMRHAQRSGAVHAFSRTGAGSISQANMQRIGMRVLTHSTAWRHDSFVAPFPR